MDNPWKTRNTLLERVKDPDDHEAWADFVEFYTSFIHIVLKQVNLFDSGIDDVTQEILLKIWKYLKSFDKAKHDVNFRTWLSKVIKNAAFDHFKKTSAYSNKVNSIVESEQAAPQNKLGSDLEKAVETEWENYLVEQALEKVKEIFSGVAVEAFELSLQGKSAKEISDSLDINQDSVRTLKNRVRIRLIEEIKNLRDYQEF